MESQNHQHQMKEIDGALLTPAELELRGLHGLYYYSSKCETCGYQDVTAIAKQPERRKSRLSRLSPRRKTLTN